MWDGGGEGPVEAAGVGVGAVVGGVGRASWSASSQEMWSRACGKKGNVGSGCWVDGWVNCQKSSSMV